MNYSCKFTASESEVNETSLFDLFTMLDNGNFPVLWSRAWLLT